MKRMDITVPVDVLTFEELSPRQAELVETARKATYRAYAPYSHFSVGAAILLGNGEVVAGANQENAAFSSGTCAERSACFYAHSQYPDTDFKCIAVAARGTDGDFVSNPIPPCGSCRQSLLEYEKIAGHPVEVLLVGRDKVYHLPSVASLLPFAFTEF